ncbi:uncharacterized protein EURHEDRAFT_217285 [Aspergillus ruber CBS 135680]|uniref:Uncharacterized protein n=1 Tax=Aspergillus ruber (strain CBS 135680) TaxID=1388766 RepID=A0A017SNS5_ASPRC|nr:uncharacterized protein EURHEDRAFT_217285 [Aspergillus ruber CBS 135680]EYE98577.1 hypothetical protein EURHEDRAFT_217285 [Aspergillus ruber CBS 135680]
MLNQDGVWRQLILKKHVGIGPNSWLDSHNCSMETRRTPRWQKPFSFTSLFMHGDFGDSRVLGLFELFKVTFESPTSFILSAIVALILYQRIRQADRE